MPTLLLLQASASATTPVDPCRWSQPGAEREMTGLYVDHFESQAFYEGATAVREISRKSKPAWLEADQAAFPLGFRKMGQGHAYLVRLSGRERFPPAATPDPRVPCPPPVSHKSSIDVRHFLQIEDLGTMPVSLPE